MKYLKAVKEVLSNNDDGLTPGGPTFGRGEGFNLHQERRLIWQITKEKRGCQMLNMKISLATLPEAQVCVGRALPAPPCRRSSWSSCHACCCCAQTCSRWCTEGWSGPLGGQTTLPPGCKNYVVKSWRYDFSTIRIWLFNDKTIWLKATYLEASHIPWVSRILEAVLVAL